MACDDSGKIFLIDGMNFRILEINRNGEFSEFAPTEGLTLPRRIRLTAPQGEREEAIESFDMILDYGELIVNRPVDPSLFSFTPPPWARIVDIEKGGGLFTP